MNRSFLRGACKPCPSQANHIVIQARPQRVPVFTDAAGNGGKGGGAAVLQMQDLTGRRFVGPVPYTSTDDSSDLGGRRVPGVRTWGAGIENW